MIGLLALARRRGWAATSAVAAFSVVGALASVVVLAAVYSPLDTNRAYYGIAARSWPNGSCRCHGSWPADFA